MIRCKKWTRMSKMAVFFFINLLCSASPNGRKQRKFSVRTFSSLPGVWTCYPQSYYLTILKDKKEKVSASGNASSKYFIFLSLKSFRLKYRLKTYFLFFFYVFEPRLQMSQKRVPRRIFGLKGEEDTGRGILHIELLHNLHSSPSIKGA
jgi:hypothetical protein